MKRRLPKLTKWSPLLRVLAVAMAFNLFLLPQVLTAQSIVGLFEECGSQPPSLIEEEALKHDCTLHRTLVPLDPQVGSPVLMHQLEERLRAHPLVEVPHQPPRS